MSASIETNSETAAAALVAFIEKTHTHPKDVIAALFCRARNGAIEHVLRTLEQHFQEKGLRVIADWEESSRPFVRISLTLRDKRTGEHVRHLDITRSMLWPEVQHGSSLHYHLKEVQTGDYYRSRKPKAAEEFDALLSDSTFQPWAVHLIEGVNYPFAVPSHSSF